MADPDLDPTERFSRRVRYYARSRPGYPPAVLYFLQEEAGLTRRSVIADIGSGTGLLARLFLAHGNSVYGVEPNQEMREEGERQLYGYPRFTSISGRAESTSLRAASVDLVTAGQAFHWFDPWEAKREFQRILRPGGRIVLIWNKRRTSDSPFLQAYERLLDDLARGYRAVCHHEIGDEALARFFAPNSFQVRAFENHQPLDFDGLKERMLSSSYAPLAGEPSHPEIIASLEKIFDRFQVAGKVNFEYDTRVYLSGDKIKEESPGG